MNESNRVIVVPIMWIVVYGIVSLLSTVFGNLRDAIFVNVWQNKKVKNTNQSYMHLMNLFVGVVKVQQNAMKEAAIDTFVHLHKLSLRFHLQR